jgi:tetratricopeptide (TPR) repeat protein
VAYGSLLQERRRSLHARIVQAIDALYPDRLTEHVDRLAHHAFEGHVWSKAVSYCRQAGVRAYERSAYAEAAAAFQRAIDALAHLPETPESARLGIDIRLELRHPATLLRQFDKVSEGLREAERLARLLSDARRLGWVLSFLAEHYRLVYELGDALRAAEHAMKVATTVADHDLRVVANLYLGQVCWTSGDYQAAARHLRANVEALQGDLSRRLLGLAGPPSIISRSWLARSLAELGEFAEGITIASDGLRIAEQLTSVFALVHVCSSSGTVHLLRGDLDAAIPLLERALALAREHVPLQVTTGAAYLGYAYARRGRLPEALALLTEAVERAPSEALTIRHLGEAHLLAGRRDEAVRLALRALEVSRWGARGGEAWTLHLLGVIAASALPAEEATTEARFHEAAELAGTLGMRPLTAHCHLGLGKLYRRTGDGAKAEEHLATAKAMYREMDMGFYLAQADAAGAGGDP